MDKRFVCEFLNRYESKNLFNSYEDPSIISKTFSLRNIIRKLFSFEESGFLYGTKFL